jgi:hypothetical protein
MHRFLYCYGLLYLTKGECEMETNFVAYIFMQHPLAYIIHIVILVILFYILSIIKGVEYK